MTPADPESEAILRALTGEPLPPPTVERVPWPDRLRHPRRLSAPWVMRAFAAEPRYSRKAALGRHLREWLDRGWAEYDRRYPLGGGCGNPGPRRPVVPWPVHADCNKAHKCPVCGSYAGVYGQLEQTGGRVRYWRMYTCQRDGQQFARRFYLREHPCDRCRPFSHVRWRFRRARMDLDNWRYEWQRRHGLT